MSKYLLGGRWYRLYSRLAHRLNWHHTTTCYIIDGTIQDWCQWCGLRMNRVNYKKSHEALSSKDGLEVDKAPDAKSREIKGES